MTARVAARALLAVALLTPALTARVAAQPAGTVTIAAHVTLATRWLDTSATEPEITPFMIGFIRAFGPRLDEAGLNLIQSFPYAGPLEDLRLNKQ